MYLGGLIDKHGKPRPEVRRQIAEARAVFQKPKGVWTHAGLSKSKKLQIYRACMVSKLLYNFSTLWLTETQMKQIDSFHYRCLRSIANTPTTWVPCKWAWTTNQSIREMFDETLLSDEVRLHQLKLLGHILRRPQDHQARIVSFDRFLQPRIWGGPCRSGNRRNKWTEQLFAVAMTIFLNDHFFQASGSDRNIMKHQT